MTNRRSMLPMLVPVLSLLAPAVAHAQALGSEFQVNTYTSSDQALPAVAPVGTSGDFVVVWESSGSSGTDTSTASIQGRRFTSDGSAIGSEFQVNTYTTNLQTVPSVAAIGSSG